MSTALQLNAAADIINGKGIAPNPQVLGAITSFQNLPNVQAVKKLFNIAESISNYSLASDILTEISKLGSGVTQAQFLIDFYPNGDVTLDPQCNGNITYYGYMPHPIITTTSGSVDNGDSVNTITGWANVQIPGTASFSNVLKTQALAPFANGMGTFANVVLTAAASASQNFDTNASITVLQNKTYATSGIGYNGPTELATGGIGAHGSLFSGIVRSWGYMFDVTNMNLLADPYVFGQNLLNLGFGNVGNLAAKLTSIGLNTNDITVIPTTDPTTQNTLLGNIQVTYPTIGKVNLPALTNSDPTTTGQYFLANNPNALIAIYDTIYGEDLRFLTASLGTVAPSRFPTTLAQYLDLTKLVTPNQLASLKVLGITDLDGFAKYLYARIGQGVFRNWVDVANLLDAIEIPKLYSPINNPNYPLLSPQAATTLTTSHFQGTGPFKNPILVDYIGVMAGMPTYITDLNTLVTNSKAIAGPVTDALNNLIDAVNGYIGIYTSYLASSAGDGSGALSQPDITSITNAVANVNNTLSFINTSSTEYQAAWNAYINIIKTVYKETLNSELAGCSFGPGNANTLRTFAQQIVTKATDATQFYSAQVFANIICQDATGDNIRAAIAEYNNSQILSSSGIELKNDPDPLTAAYMAQRNNVSISVYVNQTLGSTFLNLPTDNSKNIINSTVTPINTGGPTSTSSTTVKYPSTYSVTIDNKSGTVNNTTGFTYTFNLDVPVPSAGTIGPMYYTLVPDDGSAPVQHSFTVSVPSGSSTATYKVDLTKLPAKSGLIGFSTPYTNNSVDGAIVNGPAGQLALTSGATLPSYQIKSSSSATTTNTTTDKELAALLAFEAVTAGLPNGGIPSNIARVKYQQASLRWDKTLRTTTPQPYWRNWGILRSYIGTNVVTTVNSDLTTNTPDNTWGSDSHVDAEGTVYMPYSGSNVDVIIVDLGNLDPGHPEFAVNSDGSGGSRVVQYNWLQHTAELGLGGNGTYIYGNYDNKDSNHAAHTAGIAAGNTYGWARSANIYCINYTQLPNGNSGYTQVFQYINAFHNNKPVNPLTGIKNPTIVNNSWNLSWKTTVNNIKLVHFRGTDYTPAYFNQTNFTQAQLQVAGIFTPYQTTLSDTSTVITAWRHDAVDAAVAECIASGIIMVGIPGNFSSYSDVPGGIDYDNYYIDNNNTPVYYCRGVSPGAAPGVVCVGSLDSTATQQKAASSGCGPRVNLYAPGADVMSSINTTSGMYSPSLAQYLPNIADPRNSNYCIGKDSGTSMACPQVTGYLACLLENYPTASQDLIYNGFSGGASVTVDQLATADTSLPPEQQWGVNNNLAGSNNYILNAVWYGASPADIAAINNSGGAAVSGGGGKTGTQTANQLV